MARSQSNWDSRIYSTEPWNGITSEWFVRIFTPEMEGVLMSRGDEHASLHEHVVTRTDPGGKNGPRIRSLGSAAIQAKHERARNKRCRESFALLRLHVLDITLKKYLDRHGKDSTGRRCGSIVWVILQKRGTPPRSMMFTSLQDDEWSNASLTLVGIDEQTVVWYVILRVGGD